MEELISSPLLTEEEYRGEARGEKRRFKPGSYIILACDTLTKTGALLSSQTIALLVEGACQIGDKRFVPIQIKEDQIHFIPINTPVIPAP